MNSKSYKMSFMFGDDVDPKMIEELADKIRAYLKTETEKLNVATEITEAYDDKPMQPMQPMQPSYPGYEQPWPTYEKTPWWWSNQPTCIFYNECFDI